MTDPGARILALTPGGASEISPELIADLKRDEGLRLKAYPDPLTRADPWTCGYGHTGADVCAGLVWTQEKADAALIADIREAMTQLDAKLSWWRSLDPVRRDALVNMTFNMGIASLLTFRNTLDAIRRHDFATAAIGMLASKWRQQVGARALRLAKMIQTGQRA